MASFIASVCSAALAAVMVPLRMPLPMFSTGVQQLFMAGTNGCKIEVRSNVSFCAATSASFAMAGSASSSVLQGMTLRSS